MLTKEVEPRREGGGLAVQPRERTRELLCCAGPGRAQARKAEQGVAEAGLGHVSPPPPKLHR